MTSNVRLHSIKSNSGILRYGKLEAGTNALNILFLKKYHLSPKKGKQNVRKISKEISL